MKKHIYIIFKNIIVGLKISVPVLLLSIFIINSPEYIFIPTMLIGSFLFVSWVIGACLEENKRIGK